MATIRKLFSQRSRKAQKLPDEARTSMREVGLTPRRLAAGTLLLGLVLVMTVPVIM